MLTGLGCVEPPGESCGTKACVTGLVCNTFQDRCVEPDYALCGNGVIDDGEVCDINDPAVTQDPDAECSDTCRSTLACGNFLIDESKGERCDCGAPDEAVPGEGAPPECNGPDGSVQFNNDNRGYCKSDCTLHCGDGEVRGDEQCEGEDVGRSTCVELGFDTGVLGCAHNCRFDVTDCRRIGWYPADDTGTIEARIRAVWSSPEGTAFAAGEHGLLARRVADQWEPLPDPSVDVDLVDIWGTGDSNVYAVGDGGTIVHFDGLARSVTSVGNESLVAVWGANALLVYAVSQSGAVYRRNLTQTDDTRPGSDVTKPGPGDQWTRLDGIAPDQARDVWGLGPDDVYIVSTTGRLYHLDGDQIQQVTGTGGVYAQAVWGMDGTLVVVGQSGVIRRRVGQTWMEQETGTSARLLSVWGRGPNDVFAAGEDGVALRYDGSEWRRLNTVPAGMSRTSHTPQRFISGWSSSRDEIYAVDDNQGRVWRYHGIEWGAAGDGLGPGNVRGVWGQEHGQVFAVTADSAILGQVWRYDGDAWISVTSAMAPLRAIAGVHIADLWAVGERGTVLHHDGVAWHDLRTELDDAAVWNSSPQPALNAVWVADDGHVFIAGADGTLIHRDPQTGTWDNMDSSTGADLTALWGRSSIDLYATAGDGTIHHYDGTKWTIDYKNTGAAPPLFGLSGTGDEIYAVGRSRSNGDQTRRYTIWRRSNSSLWVDMDPGIVPPESLPGLHAVWLDAPDNIYVAGGEGIVLHFDGQDWTQVRSYTQNDLATVWGAADTAFFGGDNGTMLLLYRAESQP